MLIVVLTRVLLFFFFLSLFVPFRSLHHRYWLQSIREIKRDHPDKILIASVMAAFNVNGCHILFLLPESFERFVGGLSHTDSCPPPFFFD